MHHQDAHRPRFTLIRRETSTTEADFPVQGGTIRAKCFEDFVKTNIVDILARPLPVGDNDIVEKYVCNNTHTSQFRTIQKLFLRQNNLRLEPT